MEDLSTGDLFRYFLTQHQYAVMLHLGKFVHPETGQVERNLEAAKFTIDLLGMIEEKTRGNLSEDEDRFLKQILTTLRLNYIDEVKRGGEQEGGAEEGSGSAPETAAGPAAEAESDSEGAPHV